MNLKRNMTINKWRSKCNLSSVVTVSRGTVKRAGGCKIAMQVLGKIHEVLVDFINQNLGGDVRDAEGEF